MYLETLNKEDKPGVVDKYECEKCQDKELILYLAEDGYEMARKCDCRDRKAWKRRLKNALIPEEFIENNFENFKRENTMQQRMFEMALEYLEAVQQGKTHNFGFFSFIGEHSIRQTELSQRQKLKMEHNNFGIGKTHLHIALAKRLIKYEKNVIVVSDVTFMDEMMQAKMTRDEGESFNRMINSVLSADVLVWDDIGKAKHSEAKESLYYQIINERYRKKKPIVFNTNEDRGSLAEKIGYAAASRLIGQCGPYLLETEGADWRLIKHD